MIYFSKENIWFPRHFGSNSETYSLNLVNTTTHKRYEIVLENTSELAGWYVFDFSNVELNDGIYRYDFNGEVGLIQVGNFEYIKTEYNNETEHKVYEG